VELSLESGEISREELQTTINVEEDAIFSAFCKRLRLSDIREYENKALKEARAQAEANMQLDRQLARLRNQ
jgi:structural maintenance of chromosome 1